MPLPFPGMDPYLEGQHWISILDVWPIQLNSTLPTIPVPLLDDDEAVLDLQAAFNVVYDSVGYDELIDYSRPPDVGLVGETAVFAQAVLQKAGIVQPG